jgi:hypothetical protein
MSCKHGHKYTVVQNVPVKGWWQEDACMINHSSNNCVPTIRYNCICNCVQTMKYICAPFSSSYRNILVELHNILLKPEPTPTSSTVRQLGLHSTVPIAVPRCCVRLMHWIWSAIARSPILVCTSLPPTHMVFCPCCSHLACTPRRCSHSAFYTPSCSCFLWQQ